MMHRLWSMLTDFSGNEGGENLIGCFLVLSALMFGALIFALVRLFS